MPASSPLCRLIVPRATSLGGRLVESSSDKSALHSCNRKASFWQRHAQIDPLCATAGDTRTSSEHALNGGSCTTPSASTGNAVLRKFRVGGGQNELLESAPVNVQREIFTPGASPAPRPPAGACRFASSQHDVQESRSPHRLCPGYARPIRSPG